MVGARHRGQAPLRLRATVSCPNRGDLAGGYTDLLPQLPGAVLSLALIVNGNTIHIVADVDRDEPFSVQVRINGEPADSHLEKIARQWLRGHRVKGSATVEVICRTPTGSGLGASSQIVAGMLAALTAASGLKMSRSELACEAFLRETRWTSCGWQDQSPLVAGGFCFIATDAAETVHQLRPRYRRLTVPKAVRDELTRRMLLVWSGTSHFSRENLVAVKRRVRGHGSGALLSWEVLRGLARDGRRLLETAGRRHPEEVVDWLASIVAANWRNERLLSGGQVSLPILDEIDHPLSELGGFKLLGAGRGGYLLFVGWSPESTLQARRFLEEQAGMPAASWLIAERPARIRVEAPRVAAAWARSG